MLVRPSQLWFNFIHSRFLIYNICWEDVEVDLELLDLKPTSTILTITSAGDNALTYALQQVSNVVAVDVNPKQTYLLELKLALLQYGDQQLFYECFAKGKSPRLSKEFPLITEYLSDEARLFWNKHLHYFNPNGRGLFLQGGSGYFARFLNRMINQKNLRSSITQLALEPIEEHRAALFSEIESKLWSGRDQYLWKSDFMLSLAGIPTSQRTAIGDMNRFMKKVLHDVFVKQQAGKNPYWGAYLGLPILPEFQLPYLRPSLFEKLRAATSNMSYSTESLFDYLSNSDSHFSHFVLLDHMDWMTDHNQAQLAKQWILIFEKALPKAKILFRTAQNSIDFLPGFVRDRISFQKVEEEWLQKKDRVGTYTGTYLGTMV